MKLIFESAASRYKCTLLPQCDVPEFKLPDEITRVNAPKLPEAAEVEITRHYSALERRSYGVNNGFYPLGSCTMKYNPRVNELAAALEGFTGIHPLQPQSTVQGALEVYHTAKTLLCEITGMDDMTFQPAAGAHGEFTGLLLIKAYHTSRGDSARKKIIVPDSAHGTNPASAAMAGFEIVNIPSSADGCVDLDKLREAVGCDTAGLMLTNPNTVGIFDRNILEITKIVHEAGGLCYYDGANLNAVMGIARPGDMGFDVVHLNLHKTFSTPHGGGGPGSGPVGCKKELARFLPTGNTSFDGAVYKMAAPPQSIGSVRAFYGNFLVVVRALTYIIMLGSEGIPEAAKHAVLNANYMRVLLHNAYNVPFDRICMHEFVLSLDSMKHETGVSALDAAKALIDRGIHPPTMYFPLIVHEALMIEPTETESVETMENAANALIEIAEKAKSDPQSLHDAPHNAAIKRPDEVKAARNPVIRYNFK